MQFFFADHTLDTDRRELRRGSEPFAVEPQVFDLLVYLLQNRDRVVSKDDLIASVWGGRIVSDSTLTSRINAARKAVGDSGENQKLIRTIARKGLRFVGVVRTQPNGVEPVHASGPPPDEIHEPSRPALPLPDRPAIAVLPFTNMSGDPEQEYFSDGISEDIITALSKLRWFFVPWHIKPDVRSGSSAAKIGLFAASVVVFPFLLVALAQVSGRQGVGGAHLGQDDLVDVWYRAFNPRPSAMPLLTLLGWYRGPNTTTSEEINANIAAFLASALPSSG